MHCEKTERADSRLLACCLTRSLYFNVDSANAQSARQILSLSLSLFFSTYFQIPVHNSVMVAVVNAFQDLLNTVRGVGLAVEFPGDDVLEQLPAGDSVSVLRFNSISRERVTGSRGMRRESRSTEEEDI